MAKMKKIDSFNGFTFNVSEEKQEANVSGDVFEKNTQKEAKKRGRPKVNRELRKRTSITILPSLLEKASAIAAENGKSISQIIEDHLVDYVKNNSK